MIIEPGIFKCDYCGEDQGEFLEETGNHAVCTELAALRAHCAELEAALIPFAYECPFNVDEATVPHAGIAAAPEQVVVNMSVGWLRIEAARVALRRSELLTPGPQGVK